MTSTTSSTYLTEHQTAETEYGFAERVLLMFADSTEQDNIASAGAEQQAGTMGGPSSSMVRSTARPLTIRAMRTVRRVSGAIR